MSTLKKQTFVYGALILMISNILTKVIGAFLRIPLTNIVGVEGMAYYNAAYSIYVSFYMISTAGIPVAVSRMIASANSKNSHKEIRKIFRVATTLFFLIGVLGTGIMMIFSNKFASSANMPDANLAMLAIAPTIFFICLSSAYRGYFQGLQNMIPTAVSQLIEAVSKLGIGIICAIYFTSKGYPLHKVAAYVILGVTLGVLFGMLYSMIIKRMYTASAEYKTSLKSSYECTRTAKDILIELVKIAIPITLASSIMGLTNVVDTMLLANGLEASGITAEAATAYYGTYTSMVFPLFNLVPPFIYPFAISAIPAISSALTVGNKEKAFKDIESAFRNCAIIAIPCAIGMGCCSRNIISFLFNEEIIHRIRYVPVSLRLNGGNNMSTLDLAAPALSAISVAIFFLGIISITNSVLQACKKESYTIISTVSGIVVKIVATYFLSRIPDFGVLGSALGTVLGYFTIMCFNLFFMMTKTGYVPNASKIFTKPLIAGLLCGVSALIASGVLTKLNVYSKLTTLVTIMVAAIVYAVMLIALKGINRYDVMNMPKGDKLCKIMDRFNLLEKGE